MWEGDVVITRYMESDLGRSYWEGKTVLELGAGIGFAGMVAVLLGASGVALTDGDQKVLERNFPLTRPHLFAQVVLVTSLILKRFYPLQLRRAMLTRTCCRRRHQKCHTRSCGGSG